MNDSNGSTGDSSGNGESGGGGEDCAKRVFDHAGPVLPAENTGDEYTAFLESVTTDPILQTVLNEIACELIAHENTSELVDATAGDMEQFTAGDVLQVLTDADAREYYLRCVIPCEQPTTLSGKPLGEPPALVTRLESFTK